MSRKKVKKDVVKRKTNIYDPMGVYGRGLTENQRRGMTSQVKIENIRDTEPVITRELLEKYRRILIKYRIPTLLPSSYNIETVVLEFQANPSGIEIGNDDIIRKLHDTSITPRSFICDSFALVKDVVSHWHTGEEYYIKVGESEFTAPFYAYPTSGIGSNVMVVIPSYWMNSTLIHYFRVQFYGENHVARIEQVSTDLGGDPRYWRFLSLPNDGREIPYLLYPNNIYPELKFGFRELYPERLFRIRVKVVVMY